MVGLVPGTAGKRVVGFLPVEAPALHLSKVRHQGSAMKQRTTEGGVQTRVCRLLGPHASQLELSVSESAQNVMCGGSLIGLPSAARPIAKCFPPTFVDFSFLPHTKSSGERKTRKS